MSQLRWSRLSRRRLLLAATVALYPACGGGDGGGLTEPTTGALQVATNTSGAVPDQDGYTLSVDDVESGAIGPAAQRTIADLESGAHRIALSGVSANCEVQGQNPRAVSVVAGQTVSETFAIVCTQPPPVTGGLSVTTATSGYRPTPTATPSRWTATSPAPSPRRGRWRSRTSAPAITWWVSPASRLTARWPAPTRARSPWWRGPSSPSPSPSSARLRRPPPVPSP